MHAISGHRRPVNLSLDSALVEQAKALTGNLSAEVEKLLTSFVEDRMQAREHEMAKLRRSAAGWNQFNAKNASFADEFSTL